MTINKNEDFRSQFNSDWASKLIIAVDEVLLDKKEDSERIKNLSTSNYLKSEGKGVDKVEIEFFGKFILCSNNEENFIKVDDLEIRYWVITIFPFKIENPDLLNEMKIEIPHFTNYLTNREIKSKRVSRMWYAKEQIHTKAVEVLMRGNRTSIEKEIEEYLVDEFSLLGVDELCFSVSNLVEQLNKRNIRANNTYVSKILREHFKLIPNNTTYKIYKLDYSSPSMENPIIYHENAKGRHYIFKKEDFVK